MSASVIRPKWETHPGRHPLGKCRDAAERGLQAAHRFFAEPGNRPVIENALRIRAVENALYDLFGKGRLHGTIHTCIGQEFSGAMLGKHLKEGDFVTSNHRCHGHFIAATGQWRALIDELVGNEDGVCAGIGSSQHLWGKNFLSNGQQGGLLPVAAGIALDRKTRGSANVVVSFIGEGTLGEGITYETLNLASLWGLPQIFICENNFYSQSTCQEFGVAGSITERAAAFGIAVSSADTWDLPNFDTVLTTAIDRARHFGIPSFIALTTYRLNPHSKGDDLRDSEEIEWFRRHDSATLAAENNGHFSAKYHEFLAEAAEHIALALEKAALAPARYFPDQLPRSPDSHPVTWTRIFATDQDELRIAQQLNNFYRDRLTENEDSVFLGEDIADPYGGAFKIAKGLSTAFAPRVLTTPISEAAITGVGIGLAVTGRRAFVEIMFGDFITYAFDQIVNNASKMFHMYNRRIDCPVVIRTPMGGRRGYGPTHSQSLERFLIGIDNCCTISLNSLVSVETQLFGLKSLKCPVLLLENKSDYTAKTYALPEGFVAESDQFCLPTLRIGPEDSSATISLLAYGGMARFIANSLVDIFERTDCIPELIVPTGLHPLNLQPIAQSVRRTGRLVIIEEGAGFGNFGAEVVTQLTELGDVPLILARVSGKSAPIPSAPLLEAAALPSIDDVCMAILSVAARAHD